MGRTENQYLSVCLSVSVSLSLFLSLPLSLKSIIYIYTYTYIYTVQRKKIFTLPLNIPKAFQMIWRHEQLNVLRQTNIKSSTKKSRPTTLIHIFTFLKKRSPLLNLHIQIPCKNKMYSYTTSSNILLLLFQFIKIWNLLVKIFSDILILNKSKS